MGEGVSSGFCAGFRAGVVDQAASVQLARCNAGDTDTRSILTSEAIAIVNGNDEADEEDHAGTDASQRGHDSWNGHTERSTQAQHSENCARLRREARVPAAWPALYPSFHALISGSVSICGFQGIRASYAIVDRAKHESDGAEGNRP